MVSDGFRSIARQEALTPCPAAFPVPSPTSKQPQLPTVTRARFNSKSAVVARIYTGPKKLSPAQRTQVLLDTLLRALQDEWPRIRNSNLGVLSGTAVVEDLVMRKIQAWATELHTLCITYGEAAALVGEFARRLGAAHMQQLQVMLDVTDHSSLADFVRLMVYNTSNPLAKEALDSNPANRGGQRVRKKVEPNAAAAAQTLSTRPTQTERRKVHTAPPDQRPFDPGELRFAALLPADHSLSRSQPGACNGAGMLRCGSRCTWTAMSRMRSMSRGAAGLGPTHGPPTLGPGRWGRFLTHVMGAYQLAGGHATPPVAAPTRRPTGRQTWRSGGASRRTRGCRTRRSTASSQSDPLALYEVVPPHVMQRRKAEAAAVAAAAAALQAAAAAAQVAAAGRLGSRANALSSNAAALGMTFNARRLWATEPAASPAGPSDLGI
ncbi:MAG: hypothetical protein WDW38_001442 [Sanguina aurantia]